MSTSVISGKFTSSPPGAATAASAAAATSTLTGMDGFSNVQVTLEIRRALIEKCHRDLNLYASSILTILSTVLRSKDISLIEDSLPCFEAFCAHHDGANLASDEHYVRLFE